MSQSKNARRRSPAVNDAGDGAEQLVVSPGPRFLATQHPASSLREVPVHQEENPVADLQRGVECCAHEREKRPANFLGEAVPLAHGLEK